MSSLAAYSNDKKDGKGACGMLTSGIRVYVEIPEVSGDENASENAFIFRFKTERGVRRPLLD